MKEKNAPASQAISKAMCIRRYGAERITQHGRSRATLVNFGVKNRVVALWKSLSKASVQKARNGPSTQLIEATSCVERSNTTMKAEELS
jgi:hypothetical protein